MLEKGQVATCPKCGEAYNGDKSCKCGRKEKHDNDEKRD
jgi:hypothetical protein